MKINGNFLFLFFWVTNIPQNIFFCVPQNRGLKSLDRLFIFGKTIPFKFAFSFELATVFLFQTHLSQVIV